MVEGMSKGPSGKKKLDLTSEALRMYSDEESAFLSSRRRELEAFLAESLIPFAAREHERVFTVLAAQQVAHHLDGLHSKNLFLKSKKNQLFLVTAPDDAEVDLRSVSKALGVPGGLRFAPPELLREHLSVLQGSVTPLALLFDRRKLVTFVLHEDFLSVAPTERLWFHPMSNDATFGLTQTDFLRFLQALGRSYETLPAATTRVARCSASRRPKLDSIPVDHVFGIAREWLFFTPYSALSRNKSTAHFLALLENAAGRGEAECQWLLGVVTRGGAKVPEFASQLSKWSWLEQRMVDETCARGKYYRGRALILTGQVAKGGDELLRESAESGFVPAMTEMGWLMRANDNRALLRRAAEAGDPEGIFLMAEEEGATLTEDKRLFEAGARRGNADCMFRLATTFPMSLDELSCAVWSARCMLYSGSRRSAIVGVREALELVDAGSAEEKEFRLLFAVGRELDGCEQFWDARLRLHPDCERCVKVYADATNRARRAALQFVSGMRNHTQVAHDVVLLIAKLVYSTREHCVKIWN